MLEQPDIRVVDVLRDLWAGRLFILAGVVCGALLATVFVLSARPHYKAQIILAPANPMNGAEMSSLMADDDLFALRYMIQRVGVSNSSDFLNFENTYFGPRVADVLLQDDAIVRGLHADRAFVFSEGHKAWNAGALAQYLAKRVALSPMAAGGLRRMHYYHVEPAFASYLLEQIHAVTDRMIRERIRLQASERIQYLNEAISQTRNPEHRRTLTTLLLEQERLLMLVSIDQPYAASVVEPASTLPRVSWPDKALVFSLMGAIGALLGFVTYSLRQVPSARRASDYGHRQRLNSWCSDEVSNNDGLSNSQSKPDRAAE